LASSSRRSNSLKTARSNATTRPCEIGPGARGGDQCIAHADIDGVRLDQVVVHEVYK
jgi:hypothetical protein